MQEELKGIMTESMDIQSQEFKDFQKLIRTKSENVSPNLKNKIQLYTLRLMMRDYLDTNNSKLKTVGYFLNEALRRINIRQNKFASYINLKPPNLSRIIKDQRKINMEQALIFERIFNIEAELWLRVQAKKELAELEKLKTDKLDNYSLEELICL